jgi:hypothetical protein
MALPEVVWRPFKPRDDDMRVLEREANSETAFDKLCLRSQLWRGLERGETRLESQECSLARVIAVVPRGGRVPWEEWGRVFQWVGPPRSGQQWRILWFAADMPRLFPDLGVPLGPEHLNGGYTVPCSHEAVVVYRAEEATRVLIHELLHASCLDPVGETLETKEATIETWAELFLVALKAGGSRRRAAALWAEQAQWIRDVNDRARKHHGVIGPEAYGWRYTVGREAIYSGLGVALPGRASARLPAESRFTIWKA